MQWSLANPTKKVATVSPGNRVEKTEEEESELNQEPRTQENPFIDPELDDLVERRISEDVWQGMIGELPCVQSSTDCIKQLQAMALTNSRILQEMETRIQEAEDRIEEAKRRTLDSIAISTFSPFLQSYLTSTLPPVGPQNNILNPFQPILGNLGATLLGQGLGQLFNWQTTNANDAQLSRSIAISDLQVKLAELQRARAEIAEKLREKVILETLELEKIARNFQIQQEIAKRQKARLEIIKISYQFGEGDSKQYLADLSAYDRTKATAWREWAKLRSQLTLVKLLVLNQDES